jgi:predicted nucleotidyltransferase component of viral defense system
MLHLEAIQPDALGVLKKIMQDDYLKRFYLVGGTALALYYGHRISNDIDLFTDQHYELLELKAYVQKIFNADIYSESSIGIRCLIENIKTDFLNYPYQPIEPISFYNGYRLMTIPDISAMKLAAINNRGAKRDFYDLYFLFQHYSLQQLVEFFSRKYNITSLFSLYMSLTYFDDAEKDGDPILLINKNLTWSQVKKFIVQKVREQVG